MTEHVARYLVGGPGWPGAGPVAVGTGVLPLSVDDPGAKVTRSSRTLVTADKGNGPLRVRSFAGVGAGPVVHWLALHPCNERWQERWISRTSTSSSVPGVGKSEHWATALSRDRPEGPRAGPAQRRGVPACSLQEPGRPREPAGGGRPARHHRSPGRGSGPGHGHHRGLAEF